MAAQTKDLSSPDTGAGNSEETGGTPIASYLGIGIVMAIMVAMIALQTMSVGQLEFM